jgi:predicted flap endonuclease-1-like 5' DNA nuclease
LAIGQKPESRGKQDIGMPGQCIIPFIDTTIFKLYHHHRCSLLCAHASQLLSGRNQMTTELVWLVAAGFVLGFAASTLWEWLYFRRKRMTLESRVIAELESALRSHEQQRRPYAGADMAAAPEDVGEPWAVQGLRNPGVLLASEASAGRTPATVSPRPVAERPVPPQPERPAASPETDSSTAPTTLPSPAAQRTAVRSSAATTTIPAVVITAADPATYAPPAGAQTVAATDVSREQLATLAGAIDRLVSVIAGDEKPAAASAVAASGAPVTIRPSTRISLADAVNGLKTVPGQPAASRPAAAPLVAVNRLPAPTNGNGHGSAAGVPADNLTLIPGITPALAERLYELGIRNFRHLVAAPAAALSTSLSMVDTVAPAQVAEWQSRAQAWMEQHQAYGD